MRVAMPSLKICYTTQNGVLILCHAVFALYMVVLECQIPKFGHVDSVYVKIVLDYRFDFSVCNPPFFASLQDTGLNYKRVLIVIYRKHQSK